jgi:hypothetical protein
VIIKKEDHKINALKRVIYKMGEAVKYKTFISIFADRSQTIDNEILKVSDINIFNIGGDYLDKIGKIFNINRGGKDDINYRSTILSNYNILQSSFTYNNIINIIKSILPNNDLIKILNNKYLDIEISILSFNNSFNEYKDLINILKSTKTICSKIDFRISTSNNQFKFNVGKGFASTLDLNAGNNMGYGVSI